MHAKFQTCSFLCLAAEAAKVTCPNVLNSQTKVCIIGRVALLVMLEADQVFLYLIYERETLVFSKYMQIFGLVLIGYELQSSKVSSVVQP